MISDSSKRFHASCGQVFHGLCLVSWDLQCRPYVSEFGFGEYCGKVLTASGLLLCSNLDVFTWYFTAQKMKFPIKDFFSGCDQIRRKLQICSHLLKKSLMENFIFCVQWWSIDQLLLITNAIILWPAQFYMNKAQNLNS